MKIIRHGDINLHPVKEIPETAKELKQNGSYILARGEATNSTHVISAHDLRVYREKEGGIYVELGSTGTLVHTHDHETIEIPAGKYIQVPEREIDHFADSVERKVID